MFSEFVAHTGRDRSRTAVHQNVRHLKSTVRPGSSAAVHGCEHVAPDAGFRVGLATARCARNVSYEGLIELYDALRGGRRAGRRHDARARSGAPRALRAGREGACRRRAPASSISIAPKSATRASFIGAQAYLQGRYDGTCIIGNHVWIGPQADARRARPDHRGLRRLGPGREGARIDPHRRCPSTCRSCRPDLEIKPVRIEAWADIGTERRHPAGHSPSAAAALSAPARW